MGVYNNEQGYDARPRQYDVAGSSVSESSGGYYGDGSKRPGAQQSGRGVNGPSSQPGGLLPQGHRGGGRFGGAMQGGRGGGRGRGYSRRTPSREALVSRVVLYSATEHHVL